MAAPPDRKSVARNRSMPLDRILKAHAADVCSDDEDGATEDGSRFGTPGAIHHLRRQRHRHRDDVSEAGSQSLSVSEGSAVRAVRRSSRSSGRVALKRTSSRRVEHTNSLTGTSELLQLLSPMRIESSKSEDCSLDDEKVAGIEPEKPDSMDEPKRRRLPARSKSSDAILDHRPRGQRRPATSRRNFVHTSGGSKLLKKDPSVSDEKPLEPVVDALPAPTDEDATHNLHHSKTPQIDSESQLAEINSRLAEILAKEGCQGRSGDIEGSSGQVDTVSGDHHRHRERRGRTIESKQPSHSRADTGHVPSQPTADKHPDASKKSSPRIRSAASRSSSRHRRHRAIQRSKSDDLGGMRPTHAMRRKPSTQPRSRQKGIRSASPTRERSAEDYDYGPGSPGRDSDKATLSIGKAMADQHSDDSGSIDRFKRASSPSDADSQDSDHSSSHGGYANPYSKARKDVHSDSDDDTVLQFDPTQHDGVQEVKRKYSQAYHFENPDGTSIVGEITELADPVGEQQMLAAQLEHDRRKGALFDFLSGDGDEDEKEGGIGYRGGNEEAPNSYDNDIAIDRDGAGQSKPGDADGDHGRDRTAQRSRARVKGHNGSRFSPSRDKAATEPASKEMRKKVHRIKSGSDQQFSVDESLKPSPDLDSRDHKSQDKSPQGLGKLSPMSPSETPVLLSAVTADNEHSKLGADGHGGIHGNGNDLTGSGESDVQKGTEAGVPASTGFTPRAAKASVRDPAKKKGKGIGGIGRYFGRQRRPDEDDDIVSVGSTSVGFFNSVKAKHQLLGDDSSCDSDIF